MKIQIKNGVPYVNGEVVGWADIVVSLAGVPVTGITGVEYEDDQEVNAVYGAGRYPVGYGKGRITCKGKITLCRRRSFPYSGRHQADACRTSRLLTSL